MIRFGPFSFDPDNVILSRGGQEIPLRRKTLDVLIVLAQAGGALVSRRQLLDSVWKDVVVQDETLSSSISEIRRALGDPRSESRYLQTVHGRGFRLNIDGPEASGSGLRRAVPSETLVNRTVEMARLEAAFHESQAGTVRVVLLSGEAGIGKTRLTEEISSRSRDRGALVLAARAHDASQHSSFWIWTQLLRNCAAQLPPSVMQQAAKHAAADLVAFVPSLATVLGQAPQPPIYEPGIGRLRFFDGVTSLLRNLAENAAIVLALDDMHHAADSSVALLRAVTETLPRSPLLVICNFRPAEQIENASFTRLLEDWGRFHWTDRIDLQPLDKEDAEELTRGAATVALPPALSRKIAEDTAGNPYFIIEVARHAATNTTPGIETENYEIPRSVRTLLANRLAQLSANAGKVVRVAAVTGMETDTQIAGLASGLPAREASDAVAELIRQAVVVDDPNRPQSIRFKHELFREVALSLLSAPERASIHWDVGEALETRGTSEGHRAQLAYHFSRTVSSNGRQKAIRYGLQAAAEAQGYYANRESEVLLEQCLLLSDAEPTLESDMRAKLFELLAEAHVRAGRFDDSLRFAQRLADLGKDEDRPEWLARGAMATSRSSFPYRLSASSDTTIALLDEAFLALEERPDAASPGMRAGVTANLAMSLLARHESKRRIELARIAERMALDLADADERSHVLYPVLAAYWDPDHVTERLRICRHLEATADDARETYFRHVALLMKGPTLLACGRLRDFHANLEAHRALQAAQPVETVLRYLQRSAAIAAALRGDIDELRACIRGFSKLPSHPYAAVDLAEQLVAELMLHRELGTMDSLAPVVRQAAAQLSVYPLDILLPRLTLDSGDLDASRAQLEEIVRARLDDLPPRNEAFGWLPLVCSLGSTATYVGSEEACRRLYELLRPYAPLWAVIHLGLAVYAYVGRILGGLAAAHGDMTTAADHFETALACCEAEGATSELARVNLDFARAIERSGKQLAQTRRRAKQLRQRALDLAERHGLEGVRRKALL